MQKEVARRLGFWITACFEVERLLEVSRRQLEEAGRRYKTGDFATGGDLHESGSACISLAVVRFSTIFQSGSGAAGLVASNKPSAVGNLRDDVLAKAFPSPQQREDFDNLLSLIQHIRSNLIAHDNAAAIGVEIHSAGETHFTIASDTWKSLDIEFFRAANIAIKASAIRIRNSPS